jgi:glycerophosphoryl diester phosphodiesterase
MSDTIAIGILTSTLIKNLNKYMQLIDADAYHPNCYGESNSNGIQKLNLGGIASALEEGNYVNVWTCNNKEDLRQLLACGVSGVISDFPNRVKEALKQFNTQ